jgi:hypothetical protein
MTTLHAPGAVAQWIADRERVRFLRMQRHLATALVSGLLVLFFAPITEALLGFFWVLFLLSVFLGSLARAADARIGFLWGWLYAEPKQSTRLDLAVDRLIQRLRAAGEAEAPPVVKVRPLD